MNLLSDDQSLLDDDTTPVFDEVASDSVKEDPRSDAATREDDEYDSTYEGEPKLVQQNFTYPTHADPARRGDVTGIYLDDVQRANAEVHRAALEGREPDLENPPAIQGTPLVPTHVVKSQLPGDYVVEADKQLPVSVGTPQDKPEEVED